MSRTRTNRTRTNIEIEDRYVEMIMDRYGVRTKTEAVDLAPRHLAGQPMTREEAPAMRGARPSTRSRRTRARLGDPGRHFGLG
jgi:Arc/MetJ family transcription regulator